MPQPLVLRGGCQMCDGRERLHERGEVILVGLVASPFGHLDLADDWRAVVAVGQQEVREQGSAGFPGAVESIPGCVAGRSEHGELALHVDVTEVWPRTDVATVGIEDR